MKTEAMWRGRQRYWYDPLTQSYTRIGVEGDVTPSPSDQPTMNTWDVLKAVTPSLLIVGVVGGAAFALGSGLVNSIFFRSKR